MNGKKHFCTAVGMIFLLAVVIRLLAAFGLNSYLNEKAGREYLIAGDAEGYWLLAGQILKGEDFSLYTPPRYVMRMPGFPVVLAFSRLLFGDSLEAARYLLAVLTSLAVLPACWMGDMVHSRRAGLWAGLIAALMPVYVGFSVTILSECLFAMVILWNLWALTHWLNQIGKPVTKALIGWACLSGLLAALAVYIRPSWLLFPAGLPLIAIFQRGFRWREMLGSGLLMAGCLFLALLPWGLRNQQVTGHFVLTTLWMGPSLYDGLHASATGDSDMTFFEQDRVLDRMSEFEMNRFYKDRAIEFARQNPWRAVELAVIKFWRFWKPWPNAEQFSHPALQLVVAAGFIFLISGALTGSWVMRNQLGFVFLCWLPIVYFTALHLLFVSSLRYRLPAEYPLAVLAGIGLEFWIRRLQCLTENKVSHEDNLRNMGNLN